MDTRVTHSLKVDDPAADSISNNNCQESYMALPCDLSGSRTKNRFRTELLWGIDRILESLNEDDFAVVFDYLCDIEVVLEDSISFYQVKTSASHYTIAKLCNSVKDAPSIVAKLYELRNARKDDRVRLAIVSNAHLKCIGDRLPAPGEISFLELDNKDQSKIKDSIERYCGVEAELSYLRYIYVAIDLNQPDDVIMGKLISEFKRFRNCEPIKPNALYGALKGLVEEKACCEKSQKTFADVIANKAITKKEMDRLFALYEDKVDPAVEQTRSWILTQPFAVQREMHRALAIVMHEPVRPTLKMKVVDAIEFIDGACTNNEAIEQIITAMAQFRDAEVDKCHFVVQVVLTTFRYLFEGSRK